MSNVESSTHIARDSGPRESHVLVPEEQPLGAAHSGKAASARAFLIHLVTREIQLGAHVAGWLRASAKQLAALGMPELETECVRLATETWALDEQLLALAHRLVARRNRGLSQRGLGHLRINVVQLLEEPPSKAVIQFIALNEQTVTNAAPWAELAALAAVEQLLTGTVPLAIDLAGLDDEDTLDDLAELAELYEARGRRAAALREAADELATSDAARRTVAAQAAQRAIESFTKITRECAELGQHLDSWRSSAS